MEWPKAEAGGNRYGNNHPPVNVMTEEQVEVLRKQIAAYAAISELLVDVHRTLTAQPEPLAGIRFGQCPDPLMVSGHKMTARQRWTPTPVQLKILESYFSQRYGAPTKKRIEEITSELGKHGRITEQNVYNWFQNRRARSKRNQQPSLSLNKESKADVKTQRARGKIAKSVSSSQSNENLSPTSVDHKATIVPTRPFEDHSSRLEDCSVQAPERISHSQPLCLDPPLIPCMTSTDDYMKSSASLVQSSFYSTGLQDIGFEDASDGYYELIG